MQIINRAALILLLEGIASSGLQMITIRQVVPFVGSGVLPTSIIIASFLGALALGYYRGGKQQNYSKILIRNLLLSLAIFGTGLSHSFVSAFFYLVSDVSTGTVFNNPLLHLAGFCLLVMSPLTFLLAMTIPLLLNESKAQRKAEAAGNATAISTLGNVFGCILTSLVLMYYWGVGTAIYVCVVILTLCLLLLIDGQPRQMIKAGIAAASLSAAFILNISIPNSIFEATTPYANYSVSDYEEGRRFLVNRSSASYLGKNKEGWPYIEAMKKVIFRDDGSRILVLGAGGFTLTADQEKDLSSQVTYVDIDPRIKSIAEKSFLQDKINGKFVAAAARRFLLESAPEWDYIILDLYTNAASIPAHASTVEFFSLVSSKLAPGGRAVLNIVANPTLSDRYSQTLDATIRYSLGRCITDIMGYDESYNNIIYYCHSKSNSTEGVAGLYFDDTTEVTVDGYLSAIMHGK